MKRVHDMPFGAQVREDGSTRFRLWAPSAQHVDLCLAGDAPQILPMQRQDAGWFELAKQAARGARYRYRIDGDLRVPDPASRFNPGDVHGDSEVIDPASFQWHDQGWRGRPWEEAVIYELHVGAFSPAGTFSGVEERLDYLADLGVTAIELMPLSDFPGKRNWGYDGVLPFAPASAYGRPEQLKHLIEQAHMRGVMVLLDVVYNHFGPEGNYLNAYAKPFFTDRYHTPWGAAINYDGEGSRQVRDFVIHNALYWLEEFHFDGLRLDAVHAIVDDSRPHILEELAQAVRGRPGRKRLVHLVLENNANQARYLAREGNERPRWYDAQWNDDEHHAFHILLTGERDGYYEDYAQRPLRHLGRCLAEGFAYQGERSLHRNNSARGEPSAHLPPTAFVPFLQNHDQVGNRAFGERLCSIASEQALRAATTTLLLAPAPPLLFMGEEFAAATPFPFFCDFGPKLAAAVTAGRRREFARFARFSDPQAQAQIPDPNDASTFLSSKLDWSCLRAAPHDRWLAFYRELLLVRRQQIWPHLGVIAGHAGSFSTLTDSALTAHWRLGDGSRLTVFANLSEADVQLARVPSGKPLYLSPPGAVSTVAGATLPAWTAAWYLEPA